jgi:hypothetical protein
VTDERGAGRRSSERRDVRAAVICRRLALDDEFGDAHGETTDLSLGGFGARLDGDYKPGDVVDADLVLDLHLITVRAIVVAVTVDGTYQRVHCAFEQPTKPVADVIHRFLAARQ